MARYWSKRTAGIRQESMRLSCKCICVSFRWHNATYFPGWVEGLCSVSITSHCLNLTKEILSPELWGVHDKTLTRDWTRARWGISFFCKPVASAVLWAEIRLLAVMSDMLKHTSNWRSSDSSTMLRNRPLRCGTRPPGRSRHKQKNLTSVGSTAVFGGVIQVFLRLCHICHVNAL